MNFWRTIVASIYNPEFYSDKVLGRQTRPWRYFFKLIILLSLVLAIVGSAQLTPPLKQLLGFSIDWLGRSFPSELLLTIKDGRAMVVPEKIYQFPLWPETALELPEATTKFVLVIDPTIKNDELSLEKFNNHQTLLLLTSEFLMSGLPPDKISTVSLVKFPALTVDRPTLDSWLTKIDRLLPTLWLLVGLLILVGAFLFMVTTLVALLLLAFIVQLIARFKKLSIGYRQAYRFGLHATTLGLISQSAILLFWPGHSWYGLSIILFLLVTALNLKPVSS